MATTFNRDEPLAGLPPKHLLEGNGYTPVFKDNLEKEIALSLIKKTFEDKLKEYVELTRVSCPLFVTKRSGFNDNLVRRTNQPSQFFLGLAIPIVSRNKLFAFDPRTASNDRPPSPLETLKISSSRFPSLSPSGSAGHFTITASSRERAS
jgi:Aspartate-ammonia ligase